jgi:hypothetical protein
MAGNAENKAGSGIIAGASIGISLGTIFMRAATALGRQLSPVVALHWKRRFWDCPSIYCTGIVEA